MSNKILFTVLCLVAMLTGFSQSYTVIQVIGDIEVNGNKLSRGTKLEADDELVFKSAGAKAAVLSNEKGRYVLQKEQQAASSSDIGYAISSLISPVRGKMSTRSGMLINKLDFESRFSKPFVWIGEQLSFEVSPASYPIGNDGFFFIRYQYNGETINKKLAGANDKFILNKSEFYSVDNQPIKPNTVTDMSLFYFTVSTKKAEKLTDITIFPMSMEEFTEVYELMKTDGEALSDEQVGEVMGSLYGNYSEENLSAALSQIKGE